MRKTIISIGALACVLCLTSIGGAQAKPTATTTAVVQVGGGYSYARPDYGQRSIQGISAFADYDIGLHYGVEADFHYLALYTPQDLAENTFLIGPRVILPRGRYKFYAKAMFGVGDLVIQNQQNNIGREAGSNFAYAVGGGVEMHATRHIVIRAIDFEYQHWNYLTGLTPLVLTTGVAYRFH